MTEETRKALEEIKENMDKAWEEHSEEIETYDMWDRGIYFGINECKHLVDKYIIEYEDFGYSAGNEAIKMAISELEQDRPIGHWIETEYHCWRCSVCREKGMSEWDNIHNVRTNFCPDCGAKMDSN